MSISSTVQFYTNTLIFRNGTLEFQNLTKFKLQNLSYKRISKLQSNKDEGANCTSGKKNP